MAETAVGYVFILILIGGVIFGFMILLRKIQPIKKQPDYMEVFKTMFIEDEALNVPNKIYGLKELFKGGEKLGDIVSFSHQFVNAAKKTVMSYDEGKSRWKEIPREMIEVYTIVFSKPSSIPLIGMFFKQNYIMKFEPINQHEIQNKRIIFPEWVSFTQMGKVYFPKESFGKISRVIDDDYSKRFWEVNTQSYAATMANISAQTPEMAHELALKRLEIQAAKEARMVKTGSNLGI